MKEKLGEVGEVVEMMYELPVWIQNNNFRLEKAVCNHGFFMMAPNHWIPSSKTLRRPLRLHHHYSVNVSISHPPPYHIKTKIAGEAADTTTSTVTANSLLIRVHAPPSSISIADRQAILEQVGRMLRISEKDEKAVKEFQQIMNGKKLAKEEGVGRLFRSPTLFEDVVKSILLCNCTWVRSLNMAQALCKLQLELTSGHLPLGPADEGDQGFYEVKTDSTAARRRKGVKRKQGKMHNRGEVVVLINKYYCSTMKGGSSNSAAVLPSSTEINSHDDEQVANFPSSRELAALNEDVLKHYCNLGYRAKHIIELARNVESGRFKLCKLEEEAFDEASYEKVYQKLMENKGIGPFVSANILMCIGYYQRIPMDTETIRHLQQIHGRKSCTKKTIRNEVKEIYDKMELCQYYESIYGRLSELPNSSYHIITGSTEIMMRSKSQQLP